MGEGAGAETMHKQITFMFSKEYHVNILSLHLTKFHKSKKKWKNNGKLFLTSLSWIVVLFYKTKQLTLWSFLWLS